MEHTVGNYLPDNLKYYMVKAETKNDAVIT